MKLVKKKYNIFDIVRIPFKCSAGNTIAIILLKLFDGLIPILLINATAKFIDATKNVVLGIGSLKTVSGSAILLALVMAYPWVSKNILDFPKKKLILNIKETFRTEIVEKTAKLKYKYIENQDTWDLISRISKEPENRCVEGFFNFISMIEMIETIGLIFIKIFIYVWWAPLVILLCCIPLFIMSVKSGEEGYEAEKEVSKYERKSRYLGDVLKGRESVEERTMFSFADQINKKWYEQYNRSRKIQFKVNLKWFIRMKASGVATAIVSIVIAVILAKPTLKGNMTIGMFISILNGVFDLIQTMSWRMTYLIDQLANNKEYMKDLTKFVGLDETEGALDLPSKEKIKFNTIEFKNVSFKYPGTENYVLRNLSFKIDNGKHYALVGSNGSGKTTITKLITGLYDEYEGEILINEKNIREFSNSQLKQFSSVVYQDFSKYFVTFKDNIALGNINNMDKVSQEKSLAEVIDIMDLNDTVKNLPKGLKNNLGKIKEDGQDLSGGQWQRIAMARCIISDAELRILDEPTAALDPISESNIYEQFETISRGGTTIFISHRLGSTKLADEIYVLDNGEIKESGSFEELMSLNGIYANMYESQRSWYVNE